MVHFEMFVCVCMIITSLIQIWNILPLKVACESSLHVKFSTSAWFLPNPSSLCLLHRNNILRMQAYQVQTCWKQTQACQK